MARMGNVSQEAYNTRSGYHLDTEIVTMETSAIGYWQQRLVQESKQATLLSQ